MIKLLRTNAQNIDFISLVKDLDASLKISDGDEHTFYDQFNKTDDIHHIIVAYLHGLPIACGALKQYSDKVMEIKRMFTSDQHRGNGYATVVLTELEKWARELGQTRCILETGKKQPEAIALYLKCNYTTTDNYGQYIGVKNSLCFEKRLI